MCLHFLKRVAALRNIRWPPPLRREVAGHLHLDKPKLAAGPFTPNIELAFLIDSLRHVYGVTLMSIFAIVALRPACVGKFTRTRLKINRPVVYETVPPALRNGNGGMMATA